MNVLHMAHVRWYNAEAQYAVDLAGEMARQGHGAVVLGEAGSPVLAAATARGIAVEAEGGFSAKGLGALRAVAASRRLLALLRARRFDAVEVHRSEGLPLVVWACRRAGVPSVRVRGDMRPVRGDPLNRWLYRRGLAGVVASNRTIEADLLRRLGGDLRVITIHGGVDTAEFTPEGEPADVRAELGFPRGAFLAGILGRLGHLKGHDVFLEAARSAAARGCPAHFAVLTKEPCAREAELRARVAGDPLLRGRVGFLGRRDDLPSVLRSFDLGVVASTGSEANCRVALEWMSSGVPLVASRIGVLPDLVEEGGTGFLVGPGAASDLAEKLVYLASGPDEVRRLGAGARRRAVSRFSLERCAGAHLAHLREFLREET